MNFTQRSWNVFHVKHARYTYFSYSSILTLHVNLTWPRRDSFDDCSTTMLITVANVGYTDAGEDNHNIITETRFLKILSKVPRGRALVTEVPLRRGKTKDSKASSSFPGNWILCTTDAYSNRLRELHPTRLVKKYRTRLTQLFQFATRKTVNSNS